MGPWNLSCSASNCEAEKKWKFIISSLKCTIMLNLSADEYLHISLAELPASDPSFQQQLGL